MCVGVVELLCVWLLRLLVLCDVRFVVLLSFVYAAVRLRVRVL